MFLLVVGVCCQTCKEDSQQSVTADKSVDPPVATTPVSAAAASDSDGRIVFLELDSLDELVSSSADELNLLKRGYVLGGYTEERGFRDETEVSLEGGEKYSLFGLLNDYGEVTGGRFAPCPAEGEAVTECGVVELNNRPLASVEEGVIAISGLEYPLSPRDIQYLEPGQSEQKYANAVLKKRGIIIDQPNVVGAFSVNLDGSGDKELVIEAISPGMLSGGYPWEFTDKDYSFVAVVHLDDPELAPDVLEGFFGNFAQRGQIKYGFTVKNIVDLNGNGDLEIIVEGSYYEGGGIDIYSFSSSDGPKNRLSVWGGL